MQTGKNQCAVLRFFFSFSSVCFFSCSIILFIVMRISFFYRVSSTPFLLLLSSSSYSSFFFFCSGRRLSLTAPASGGARAHLALVVQHARAHHNVVRRHARQLRLHAILRAARRRRRRRWPLQAGAAEGKRKRTRIREYSGGRNAWRVRLGRPALVSPCRQRPSAAQR